MNDNSLSQQLFSQLQGAPMQQIAQQLGTNPEQASAAVSQALPLLMGALGKQASNQGVQNLFGSLGGGQGGLGGMLGGLLGGGASQGAGGGLGGLLGSMLGGGGGSGASQPGAGIPGSTAQSGGVDALLGSLFGGRQAQAEEGLGQASGLGSKGAHSLLLILAPIVLSFLGQRFLRRDQVANDAPPSLDRLDTQGLDQALTQEEQQLQRQGGGNMLNSLLDQNGDGKLDMNDFVKLGSSLLGGRR